ncbi:MAG TPA: tripartite tricarboxylate transporter substrate binding protein [Ramlibacter sp.]|nr:tripartite tricarboxylate transporter substrate binding protein [Ramlibacter sp.]
MIANHARRWLGAAALLLAALAPAAHAEYPDRPIKAVVPFPPGGGTDIFGRLVGQHLSQALGQSLVVENRPGAEGNIGMEAVARSAPDGYTLLFNSSAATVNPAMYTKLRFDPAADLVPVAVVCEYYNVIVVNPEKVPARTLQEFVEFIRKNPGKVNAAAGGTRLGIDIFRLQNNLDLAVIPYRGGGDAITALLKGEADFMIVNTPGIIQHMKAGKLRALAVTAPQRQVDIPDVPTTREAGMPQYNYGSFFGVYTRAGTPPDVIAKLNASINAITGKPEVVKALRDGGAERVQRTPEESLRQYLGEMAKMKDAVARARIPTLD